MTRRYSLIFCVAALLVGAYCGYFASGLINRQPVKMQSDDIAAQAEALRISHVAYKVIADGVTYYADHDIEYVAGFPMMVIMHNYNGTHTVKAEKSLKVEKRK